MFKYVFQFHVVFWEQMTKIEGCPSPPPPHLGDWCPGV